MSATNVEAFDKTLQTTNLWLNQILAEMGWQERHKSYTALRAVLHTLRDCLIVEEAADLGAQLPLLVRGAYYEGWVPAKTPQRMSREDFLAAVTRHFPREPEIDAKRVVRSVFRAMAHQMPGGELSDVKHMLPKSIQELWPLSVR